MEKPILPVVTGPTACGKTACAVELCRMMDGEVVSADSMQIYRGMDTLTAIPNMEERKGVAHHLMACLDPSTPFSVDAYRTLAKKTIAEIRSRGKLPVLCGGTGLYIDAVTRPMSFSQKSDPDLHAVLLKEAELPDGRMKLHARLQTIDPDAAARLHPNDVRRVCRAIEIYELTGVTQTEHARLDRQREVDYRECIFALEWPMAALYRRIDARVDEMIANGMIDEVRRLMDAADDHPTAKQAIGYRQIAAALRGEIGMDEAITLTKRDSRNFAKRQMTWFRRDSRVVWLPAEGKDARALAEEIQRAIDDRINSNQK